MYYRTKCHLRWPEVWDGFRKDFDVLLTEAYEKDYCKHGLVNEFIVGFKNEMLLFIEATDLEHLKLGYLKDQSDPNSAVLQRVLDGSRIGATLFAECGARLFFLTFRANIDKRIDALEDINFLESDVASYKALTDEDIKVLKTGGHSNCDEVVNFDLLNFTCERPMLSYYDIRDHCFAARVKSLALNAGDLKPLPHEEALFDIGHVPNYRATVHVPQELLVSYANAREAVLKLLPPSAVTFSEMKKLLRPHLQSIKKLDPTFENLEWEVLENHADDYALTKVKKEIIDLLPDEKTPRTFIEVLLLLLIRLLRKVALPLCKCTLSWRSYRSSRIEVLKGIEKIRAGKLTRAAGPKLQFDINGVFGLITNLDEGVGPAPEKVKQFNDFYQKIAIKLPFFYPQPNKDDALTKKAGKLNFKTAEARGLPALHELFNKMAQFKDKGGVPSLEQLAPLRTYKYVLDEKMVDALSKWVTIALQNHKASKNLLSITDGEALKPSEKLTESSGSSSSGKKLSAVALAKTVKPLEIKSDITKGKKKAAELEDTTESVLGFFVGKKKKVV